MTSPSEHRWPGHPASGWLVFFVASHLILVLFPGNADGRHPGYHTVLLLVAGVGALVTLVTARPWGSRLPRRLLLAPLWIGSVLLVLRGVPGMVELALVAARALLRGGPTETDDIPTGELWLDVLVNAYFSASVVLLAVALRHARRRQTVRPREWTKSRSSAR